MGAITTLLRDSLLSDVSSEQKEVASRGKQIARDGLRNADIFSSVFAGLGVNQLFIDDAVSSDRFGYFETGTLRLDGELAITLEQPAIVTLVSRQAAKKEPVIEVARAPLPASATQSSDDTRRTPRAALGWSQGGFIIYDAHVSSQSQYANANYGGDALIGMSGASGAELRTFVKIDLSSSEDITNATLTLHPLVGGSGTYNVSVVRDNDWGESQVTWNNRPTDIEPSFFSWNATSQPVAIDITEQARRARFLGDVNLDGELEIESDIKAFETAVKQSAAYVSAYGLPVTHAETKLRADTDHDGDVDSYDAPRFYDAHGFLQADVNLDGTYTLSDFNIIGMNYTTGTTQAQGDVTFDGIVNAADLNVVGQVTVGDTGSGPLPQELSLQISGSAGAGMAILNSVESTDLTKRPAVSITATPFDPDDDGLINAVESHIQTNANDEDSDVDGIPDGWELKNGLDPNDANDGDDDLDADNLTNLEEWYLETSPSSNDTDGDGVHDDVEYGQGSNPRDASDNGTPSVPGPNDSYITIRDGFWVAGDYARYTLMSLADNEVVKTWSSYYAGMATSYSFDLVVNSGVEYELRWEGIAGSGDSGTSWFDPSIVPSDSSVEVFDYDNQSQSPTHTQASVRVRSSAGDLTAYRPQMGAASYAPFARTAVANVDEEDPERGPGIRYNGDDDNENSVVDRFETSSVSGEDDLIEVEVTRSSTTANVVLRQDFNYLSVWNAHDMSALIPFDTNHTTGNIDFDPGELTTTVWVERTHAGDDIANLYLEDASSGQLLDTLAFHRFTSVVIFVAGEFQHPTDPVLPENVGNYGTIQFAIDKGYNAGYDTYMFDEEDWNHPDTTATAAEIYPFVVNAVNHYNVDHVGLLGYSHGGGTIRDLSELMFVLGNPNAPSPDFQRAFSVDFTAYVDAVSQEDGIFFVLGEPHKPVGSNFHLNQYQENPLSILGGRSMRGSFNIDYTDTLSHSTIDDDPQVLGLMDYFLRTKLPR